MGPDTVQSLEIWKDSVELVTQMYAMTAAWPKDEAYGLTSQLRRAATSVPANIAEGVGRGSAAEAARFALIARGSIYEVDTLLHLAERLKLTTPESAATMREQFSSLSRRISSFIRYKKGK